MPFQQFSFATSANSNRLGNLHMYRKGCFKRHSHHTLNSKKGSCICVCCSVNPVDGPLSSPQNTAPLSASTTPATSVSSNIAKHTWIWRGHKIRYVSAGCGKPILLVHGFGASYGHFKRNIPVLAAAGYKVYALDLLGFGESEKPILQYTMELWEEQIKDFLNEFCQGQPAVLIGNSMGSLASLMVSASSPDQVSGTVLINCAGGMNNKAISDDWRIKVAMPLLLLIDLLLNQEKIARYLFDGFRKPESLKKVLLNVYRNQAAVDDDLVHMLYAPSCDQGALECFVSVITGPPGPSPQTLVPKLKKPLLVMWGTDDPFTPHDGPVGKYFRGVNAVKPDAQFVGFEGVGHCPQDEAEELVHAELLPWLEQVHV